MKTTHTCAWQQYASEECHKVLLTAVVFLLLSKPLQDLGQKEQHHQYSSHRNDGISGLNAVSSQSRKNKINEG